MQVLGLALWWLRIWRDHPACSVTSSSGCRVLTVVRTMAGDLLLDWTWEPVIERRVSRLIPGFLIEQFDVCWLPWAEIFTSPCMDMWDSQCPVWCYLEMGPLGGNMVNGISALRDQRKFLCLAPCEDTARKQLSMIQETESTIALVFDFQPP